MNRITVDKAALITKLRENRTQHVDAFTEAVAGWRETVTTELEAAAASFQQEEDLSNMNFLYRFPKPQSHSSQYDRALEMLDWETADTIHLEEDDFRHFVQDDWDWSQSFVASNSRYTASLVRD